MTLCASQSANFIIGLARTEGTSVSPLQLHSLVYIALGWSLATLDRDILGDEEVLADKHGPVIPSIYHQLKRYGNGPVTDHVAELSVDSDDNRLSCYTTFPQIPAVEVDLMRVLEFVWDVYKQYSDSDLIKMIAASDFPRATHCRESTISKSVIKAYYREQVRHLLAKQGLDHQQHAYCSKGYIDGPSECAP